MKYFGRIDNIVGVLASLGAVKTVADVNRKIVMSPTSDYENRTWPSPVEGQERGPGSMFVF